MTAIAAATAGCGADVSATAVTAAQRQASQAEQARKQQAEFNQKLGDAMRATNAAASAAGEQ